MKPVTFFNRRKFISNTIKASGVLAFANSPISGLASQLNYKSKDYTVQDIINLILKEIPGVPLKQTVDTIKSGNLQNKVSGIVTTMFATIDVIKAAAKLGANFIIAHEPTFYNHEDDINYVANNTVVKQKQALLDQYQITVWRFHDYWHMHKPDGIYYGVLKNIGWLPYYNPDNKILQVPATPLKEIISLLKKNLGISHLRMVGDLNQVCKKIALLPGAEGGQAHLTVMEKEKPDLLIVGEIHEWETGEYFRDSRLLGNNISLVVLGHAASEEPGMEYLVEWLQPQVPELKITHLSSGSPFDWV